MSDELRHQSTAHTKPHIMRGINGYNCISAAPGVMLEGSGKTCREAYEDWCEKYDAHRMAIIKAKVSYWFPADEQKEPQQ